MKQTIPLASPIRNYGRKLLLSLPVVVVLLSGCKGNREAIVTEFPTTGSLNSAVVRVPSLEILNPGNVAVYDDKLFFMESEVPYVFDVVSLPLLDTTFRTGFKGRGPDEFIRPSSGYLQVTDNGLRVLDNGTMLKEVEVDDNLIARVRNIEAINIKTGDPINRLVHIGGDLYCMANGLSDESDHEYILANIETGEQKHFGTFDEPASNYDGANRRFRAYLKEGVAKPDGTRVAYFYSYFKKFKIFDTKTFKLFKDVNVEISPYNTPADVKNKSDIRAYGKPFAVGDYIYVVCGNSVFTEGKKPYDAELQIWDWDGNPIGSYRLDRPVWLYAISEKHNKMYAIDTENSDTIYVFDLPVIS